MPIFLNMLKTSILSGIVIGIALSLVHVETVYPLIFEAELYEEEAAKSHPHFLEQALTNSSDTNEETEWFPEEGLERTLFSTLSNIFHTIAYALLFNIAFILKPIRHWRDSALWGLSGAMIFYVIPTLVYDPVLPGTIEADHFSRQLWWLATIECSAFGLAIFVFMKQFFLKFVGVFLIVAAVLIGSPPGEFIAFSPSELVNTFIAYNLVINIIYWMLLGITVGYLINRTPFNLAKSNV